jgi:hypothetical protein
MTFNDATEIYSDELGEVLAEALFTHDDQAIRELASITEPVGRLIDIARIANKLLENK